MQNPHMAAFSPQARLNEDLYLDSVLVLQLMLHLELDLGLRLPDTHLTKDDYATVASLVAFLQRTEQQTESVPPATSASAQEEFEDVKVHCFVSCVCESLKRAGIDHRPFYFGVWDATFTVTEDHHLRYHAEDVDHADFRYWFNRLFGVALVSWYCPEKDKASNIATLQHLLATKRATEQLMVMLDLFQLPERENKFNQNPFPHYVLLTQGTTPEQLWISDPDFRWEGELETARVLQAVAQPTVAGGYVFDEQHLHSASDAEVKAYFDACFFMDRYPLAEAIETIVDAHMASGDVAILTLALREIRVIAVRKYAYEHGFAFFWRALGLPEEEFEAWCEVIESLVQGYFKVQYLVMKLAETGVESLQSEVAQQLVLVVETEREIKQHLHEVYRDWCEFALAFTPASA
ncbi:phosphopantetheine-binding protein [Photobacterium aphoticum]|uniref:Phosphopantetheine-binding protein n=2 Tax=Photobacterium aphoticum TaxID=754436 RepID=A0A0J1GIA2_9GAMM|nr:phosphopantetheine-binding protein [Photobacterium aphoticum]PSU55318.1 phosphopantetheine-binding protein [Photobacterium aphoticum]